MGKGSLVKGEYGYLKKRFTRLLLVTILLFCAAFGVLVLGISLTGSKKNLLTIFAMLGILPACRSLIELIMVIRAQKYQCPDSLHKNILLSLASQDQTFIKYDLYMTAYEHNFPMYAVACKCGSLVCYMGDSKQVEKDVKTHLETLLKQNALKVGNIKIFFSENKFVERITELGNLEETQTEMDAKVLHLMENISL